MQNNELLIEKYWAHSWKKQLLYRNDKIFTYRKFQNKHCYLKQEMTEQTFNKIAYRNVHQLTDKAK